MTETQAGPKRPRNQRGEGARLRVEVIEAAMRILDRTPSTQLSLRMVAREAGVAAPSLYRQFADAEAMIKEIVRECWEQVSQAMADSILDMGSYTAIERLQSQTSAYVRYAMLRPSRYNLLFAPPIGRPVEITSPAQPASRALRETIEQHEAGGGKLPAPDALLASIFTMSFVHGRIALAHLAPDRRANSPEAVDTFVRAFIQRLFS